MSYCLEEFSGAPGPDALVKDSGVLSFALSDGILQARGGSARSSPPTGVTLGRRSPGP